MGSCRDVDGCDDEATDDLQATVARQTAEIRDLKTRLESCDETIAERNCLRELCDGFDRWKEQIEHWHKRNYSELMCAYKTQLDKYNGALAAQRKCEVRSKELRDTNDRAEGQLRSLKSNEAQLKTLLTVSENNRRNAEAALRKIEPRLEAESAAAARNLACAAELRGRLDETAAGRDELAAALAVAERCAGLAEAEAEAEAEAAADELRAARRELAESEARRAHLECRIERAAAACRPDDTGDGGGPGPLEARVARLETGVRARDDRMCRIETAAVKAARRGGGRAKADGVHRGRRTDAAAWALVHKYSASAAAAAADGCPMRARLDALKCELNTLRDDVRDVCARDDQRSAGSRRVWFD